MPCKLTNFIVVVAEIFLESFVRDVFNVIFVDLARIKRHCIGFILIVIDETELVAGKDKSAIGKMHDARRRVVA